MNETTKENNTETLMDNKAEVSNSTEITHHYPTLNNIRYHYAEAGEGPLVILLHGNLEFWYSWRRQLPALAEAGYHAVALDLRGFGESEVTPKVEDYSLVNHARDVKALIDHLSAEKAVVIGHDWGSNLMWIMPMLYPDTVKAVVSLSIPFYPEPRDPGQMKAWAKDKFNFAAYFAQKGAAEAEFNEDPERFFRLFFYGFSGDAPGDTIRKLYLEKSSDAKLLDGFPEPDGMPDWFSREDLNQYVEAYTNTGITPAMNFYRNIDHDYPLLKEIYKADIPQPALFIGGGEEAAVKFGSLDPMKDALPKLRKALVLPGCGHWVQQERTKKVNKTIIEFLDGEMQKQ